MHPSSNFARYFHAAVARAVAELDADTVTDRKLSRAAFNLGALLHLDGVTDVARTVAVEELVAVARRRSNCTDDEARRCVSRAMHEGTAKPYSPKSRPPAPNDTSDPVLIASPPRRVADAQPGDLFAGTPARPAGGLVEERLARIEERLDAVLAYVRQGGR
jgi:hypothetical protein